MRFYYPLAEYERIPARCAWTLSSYHVRFGIIIVKIAHDLTLNHNSKLHVHTYQMGGMHGYQKGRWQARLFECLSRTTYAFIAMVSYTSAAPRRRPDENNHLSHLWKHQLARPITAIVSGLLLWLWIMGSLSLQGTFQCVDRLYCSLI